MDWKRIGRGTLTTFEWLGVIVFGLILLVIAGVGGMLAWVGDPPPQLGEAGAAAQVDPPTTAAVAPTPTPEEAGSLFAPIYQVLMSPRCMNCHPAGPRPLADKGGVHAMNISRTSADSGLACSTCHAEHNSKVHGGPPGAPHWGLPPADVPSVFEGRGLTELCQQLRDPERNGQRSLAALHEHMEKDPLVLWGWNPGGDRSTPPISHADFVAAISKWVEAGGICPGETEPPILALAAEGEEAGAEAGYGEQDPAHAPE